MTYLNNVLIKKVKIVELILVLLFNVGLYSAKAQDAQSMYNIEKIKIDGAYSAFKSQMEVKRLDDLNHFTEFKSKTDYLRGKCYDKNTFRDSNVSGTPEFIDIKTKLTEHLRDYKNQEAKLEIIADGYSARYKSIYKPQYSDLFEALHALRAYTYLRQIYDMQKYMLIRERDYQVNVRIDADTLAACLSGNTNSLTDQIKIYIQLLGLMNEISNDANDEVIGTAQLYSSW